MIFLIFSFIWKESLRIYKAKLSIIISSGEDIPTKELRMRDKKKTKSCGTKGCKGVKNCK